jgi:hypothetical protein
VVGLGKGLKYGQPLGQGIDKVSRSFDFVITHSVNTFCNVEISLSVSFWIVKIFLRSFCAWVGKWKKGRALVGNKSSILLLLLSCMLLTEKEH